jgi:hypothetical protein
MVAVAVKECLLCDYQFTSKSMLMTVESAKAESATIRESFPFEPERDEDGSLIISNVLGRRVKKTGRRHAKERSSSIVSEVHGAAEAK